MYISATKQSKDRQKQAIIINKCIKHKGQEETHICIYIYKFIVHFIRQRDGERGREIDKGAAVWANQSAYTDLLLHPIHTSYNALPQTSKLKTVCYLQTHAKCLCYM